MARSLAEQVALLPESERKAILNGFDPDALLWDWSFWGRPEQRPPQHDNWSVYLYSGGRGSGKTRAAAEWIRDVAKQPNKRIGLVARTSADVRDVIVEGDSGIIGVTPPSERPEWQPSKRKLTWPNGTTALAFTADEPDQLRGPQFDYAWGDEIAAWRQVPDALGLTAWDNLRIATRLGETPQIMLTSTPKKVPVFRGLMKEAEDPTSGVIVVSGSTKDNAGNLSRVYLDAIYGIYEGTKLAQQELEGILLDAVEGALWAEGTIEAARVAQLPPRAGLLGLVGVDPTVAERPGDECGIVVCLATNEREVYKRQGYVVEDATVMGSPEVWASAAVSAARRWGLPIVAETNQGGALVKAAIQAVDPGVPVVEVHSMVGKALRAEPVSLGYEQGRVHHLGVHADLETQMTTWIPGEGRSPDRVDALVHALTALMVRPPVGFTGGSLVAHAPRGSIQDAALRGRSRSGRTRGGRLILPRRFA